MSKKKIPDTAYYRLDNIVAPATAVGSGAIGIIRLSGNDVITIADAIFTPSRRQGSKTSSLKGSDSYKLVFGKIMETPISVRKKTVGNTDQKTSFESDLKTFSNSASQTYHANEKLIDECLAAVFRAPNSYTGENSVEFYTHASSYIMEKVQRMLLDVSATLLKEGKISSPLRVADAGEFTKRAFLNGKMDLAQAEAVADLIASETEASHAIAINQMRGEFSKELRNLRQELLGLCTLIELELDFSEEDVEFADRQKLSNLMSATYIKIKDLADSFALGNVVKSGIPVAIVGAVNTGKSTLLNLIVGEERAIVSPIQGTTRDTIEDNINIGGTMFRFIDTAGIRNTRQTIEMMGIERTWRKLKESSVIILMLDSTNADSFRPSIKSIAEKIDQKRQTLIIIANKLDKNSIEGEVATTEVIRTSNHSTKVGQKNIRTQNEVVADDIVAHKTASQKTTKAKDSNLSTQRNLIANSIQRICLDLKLKKVKIFTTSLKTERTEAKQTVESFLSDIGNRFINNIKGKNYVTNLRHYQALKDAQASIEKVLDALDTNLPTDLLAQDLRQATNDLGSIIGEITSQDVLNNIFAHFCIGK